jgi:hypothetical protein
MARVVPPHPLRVRRPAGRRAGAARLVPGGQISGAESAYRKGRRCVHPRISNDTASYGSKTRRGSTGPSRDRVAGGERAPASVASEYLRNLRKPPRFLAWKRKHQKVAVPNTGRVTVTQSAGLRALEEARGETRDALRGARDMALDSAPAVYRAALSAMGVEGAASMSHEALRPCVHRHPRSAPRLWSAHAGHGHGLRPRSCRALPPRVEDQGGMVIAMNVQPIRPPPKAAGSPARAELAPAIAEAAEAARREAAAHEAVERARPMVADAAGKLSRAGEAVAAARQAQAGKLVVAATAGSAAAPDRSAQQARVRELDAEDELDAARSALATVEEAVGEPEYQAKKASQRLQAAADAVLAAEVSRLADEAKAIQADLIERRVVFRFLLHELRSAGGEMDAARDFMRHNTDLPGTFLTWTDWDRHPATTPWATARQHLTQRADAPLPEK